MLAVRTLGRVRARDRPDARARSLLLFTAVGVQETHCDSIGRQHASDRAAVDFRL